MSPPPRLRHAEHRPRTLQPGFVLSPGGFLLSCEPHPDLIPADRSIRELAVELAEPLGASLWLGTRMRSQRERSARRWALRTEAERIALRWQRGLHLSLAEADGGGGVTIHYDATREPERQVAGWVMSGLQSCGLRTVAYGAARDPQGLVPWLRARLPADRYIAIELSMTGAGAREALGGMTPLPLVLPAWLRLGIEVFARPGATPRASRSSARSRELPPRRSSGHIRAAACTRS